MLLIDLYRTIIINLIFTEHISTRLGHAMTDTYIFFSPSSSAQNVFPRFVCPPCPLGAWFHMRFYVSIFLYCVEALAISFCLLNIGYMTCCKTSKLSWSPCCLATLFLHLLLLVMEIASFLSHLHCVLEFWLGGTEGWYVWRHSVEWYWSTCDLNTSGENISADYLTAF